MANKARRHVHKYHKVNLGFADAWACALPDCTHYMPPTMEKLVEGKKSICWECNKEFIIDIDSMQSKRPICNDCKLGLDSEIESLLTEAIEKFLNN